MNYIHYSAMNNSATLTTVGHRVNGFIVLMFFSTTVVTILHSHQLNTFQGCQGHTTNQYKSQTGARVQAEHTGYLSGAETRPAQADLPEQLSLSQCRSWTPWTYAQVPAEFPALVCLHVLSLA